MSQPPFDAPRAEPDPALVTTDVSWSPADLPAPPPLQFPPTPLPQPQLFAPVLVPAPRRRRTGLILLAASGAAVAAVLAVAVILTIAFARPGTHGGSAPAAAGPASLDPGEHPGDLLRYLLPMPAGAHPHEGAGRRVVDAGEAATFSINMVESESGLLERNDFRDGAVDLWVTADGLDVVVVLLRFAGTQQAISYFAAESSDVAGEFKPGDIRYVDGVPDTRAMVTDTADSDGYYYTYGFASRGDIVIVVTTREKDTPPSLSSTSDLLSAQYAKL